MFQKLKATDQAVARRQGHLVQVGWVPGAKQDAPVVWPRPDQVYHVGQLVHALATVVGMHVHILCAKVAPLKKTITWKLDITSV